MNNDSLELTRAMIFGDGKIQGPERLNHGYESKQQLTDEEIESIKTFANKRIGMKILHAYGKTKEEICGILCTDPDVVEEAMAYINSRKN